VVVLCVLFFSLDDFILDNVTVAFNSSNVNSTMCWTFRTNNDMIPENDENIIFDLRAENPLDSFPDGNTIDVLINEDDDGE